MYDDHGVTPQRGVLLGDVLVRQDRHPFGWRTAARGGQNRGSGLAVASVSVVKPQIGSKWQCCRRAVPEKATK